MSVKDISIIGGGWSAANADLANAPGLVIGVNDSAVQTRCDIAVSMDRLWTEYRWPQLCAGLLSYELRHAWIRRAAAKNIEPDVNGLRLFECSHKSTVFSEHAGTLNGTNSGMCAFNLAYQMRPARIWLFGFDMNRSPDGQAYWYPPYPWAGKGATTSGKYKEWSKQFDYAAKQCVAAGIKVLNVSTSSAIDSFTKIDPRDLQRALERAA